MKFVSKSGNYRVILDRGIPGEPITGRSAVPGLSVKFEDGVVIVNDEDIIKKMIAHPSFQRDFISVEENKIDPFLSSRRPMEPEHDVVSLEYGHIGKNQNPKSPIPMSPELKKVITDMAVSMAKEMAPTIAIELLKKMKADSEIVPAKKAGRPKKTQNAVSVE